MIPAARAILSGVIACRIRALNLGALAGSSLKALTQTKEAREEMFKLGNWDYHVDLWMVGNKVYGHCDCGQCDYVWVEVDPGTAYLALGRRFGWLAE